jgi:hypothetical protein
MWRVVLVVLCALVVALPVPRRALVLIGVFARRLLPVVGRKLRLVSRDYTTARAIHAPSFNENLDPKSQQTFVKIFLKLNAWRQSQGADVIQIRPSA